MGKRRRVVAAVLVVVTLCAAEAECSGLAAMDADGWYTWRAPAADDARSLCCFAWSQGRSERRTCNLDERRGHYGHSDTVSRNLDEVQLYARVEAGVAVRIRALSPDCPVTAASPIADLGSVESRTSVEWLRRRATVPGDARDDAMMAIAAHDGETAVAALATVIEDRRLDMETRREALFWLAQTGSDDAIEYFDRLLGTSR